jgi:hypothetical protein
VENFLIFGLILSGLLEILNFSFYYNYRNIFIQKINELTDKLQGSSDIKSVKLDRYNYKAKYETRNDPVPPIFDEFRENTTYNLLVEEYKSKRNTFIVINVMLIPVILILIIVMVL